MHEQQCALSVFLLIGFNHGLPSSMEMFCWFKFSVANFWSLPSHKLVFTCTNPHLSMLNNSLHKEQCALPVFPVTGFNHGLPSSMEMFCWFKFSFSNFWWLSSHEWEFTCDNPHLSMLNNLVHKEQCAFSAFPLTGFNHGLPSSHLKM